MKSEDIPAGCVLEVSLLCFHVFREQNVSKFPLIFSLMSHVSLFLYPCIASK